MRKEIYNGDYHGFYRSHIFSAFISNQKGFEEIVSGSPCNLFVGHLSNQNVTVRYRTYGEARSAFDFTGKSASVVLFGNREGIGEVEKLVLEGAKRHEQAQEMATLHL